MKIPLALLAVALLSLSANAPPPPALRMFEVSHTRLIPMAPNEVSWFAQIPTFNTALGTLAQVRVTYEQHRVLRAKGENLSGVPASWQHHPSFGFSDLGNGFYHCPLPMAVDNFMTGPSIGPVTPFDDVLDYAGTSGWNAVTVEDKTMVGTAPGSLDCWKTASLPSQPGLVQIGLWHWAMPHQTFTGPVEANASQIICGVGGSVTVTYRYTIP